MIDLDKTQYAPLAAAIRAFLQQPIDSDDISPFLALEEVQNECANPEKTAREMHRALRAIRPWCEDDFAFCLGALDNMIDNILNADEDEEEEEDEWFMACLYAPLSDVYIDMFENRDEERCHRYIAHVEDDMELTDFSWWMDSLFASHHYPEPHFEDDNEFLDRIAGKEDAFYVWFHAAYRLLRRQKLTLLDIDSSGTNHILAIVRNDQEVEFCTLVESFGCHIVGDWCRAGNRHRLWKRRHRG